jgi:AcrR family transcriptional regulator
MCEGALTTYPVVCSSFAHRKAPQATRIGNEGGSAVAGKCKRTGCRRVALDILSAAATASSERGYAATSIDDVARRLGATKGRVYHHFSSKGDLFAQVFKTGMDMNFEAIAPIGSPAGDRRVARDGRGACAADDLEAPFPAGCVGRRRDAPARIDDA